MKFNQGESLEAGGLAEQPFELSPRFNLTWEGLGRQSGLAGQLLTSALKQI